MAIHPSPVTVRKGNADDLEAVYGLIKELAVFEKEPDEPSNPFEVFYRQGTGEIPWYHVLVAETSGEVIGMALYYNAYSTWKGAMYYLDDLVVKEQYRRSGIGSMLLKKFLEEAEKNEVNMVKWQVLDWNEAAIKFYQKYNTEIGTGEWLNCRILKENFK